MPLSSASTTDLVNIFPSATKTSGTAAVGNPFAINGLRIGVNFTLDVTATATDNTDTLDVYVQALVEGSLSSNPVWLDVLHFTQVNGGSGAKRYIGKVLGNSSEAMYDTSSTLTAGSIKGYPGDYWRVKYTIVSGNSASFQFAVWALPF
jgi:hypothetical protein